MKDTELPKVILQRKAAELERMSDQEFFTREDFQRYLNQILKAVVSASKGGKIELMVVAQDNETTGCTDGQKVLVNVLAPFIRNRETRNEKLFAIIGLLAHECGHILFTDTDEQEKFLEDLEKGICRGCPDVEKILAEGSPQFRVFAFEAVDGFRNIVEDDYVEYRLLRAFAGLPAICLKFTRKTAADQTWQIMMEGFGTGSLYENVEALCLLQVQKEHSTKRLEKRYPKEFREAFPYHAKIMELMKKIRSMNDSRMRMETFKKIVSIILPLIKTDFQEQLEEEKEKRQAGPEAGSGQPKEPDCPEETMETDPSRMEEELGFRILKSQKEKQDEKAKRSGRMDSTAAGKEQIKSPYFHADCGADLPDAMDAQRYAQDELEVLKSAREEEELDGFADRVLSVRRKVLVTADMRSSYQEQMRSVQPVVDRTVRMLNSAWKDRQLEGRLSGQILGKKMDMRQAYRSDGRFYTKELVPEGSPRAAFGIRIDESGSMEGNKILTAKKTAIALEAIFRSLSVPHCIYGDTADREQELDVIIHKYAEFDAFDNQDRYRLANIRAYNNNHDACALRFVANALKRRAEPQKILVVISDGLPAARGFNGHSAVLKTLETVREIEKEGIHVFAAALNGCYDDIVRIYGNERTMDVRDLELLPKELTKLVKKYCLRRWV